MNPEIARQRVIIQGVEPEVDCGRFPIKRTSGETVKVTARIFADGHDALAAMLHYRKEDAPAWNEVPMQALGNDYWQAEFPVQEIGRYCYTLQAWVDEFQTWQKDLQKRLKAGQEVSVELQIGANLVSAAAARAADEDAHRLATWADRLRNQGHLEETLQLATGEQLGAVMAQYPDRRFAAAYEKQLAVVVDRQRARFSAWYELFPRSASPEPGRHGTFRDCEAWLPYIAGMGFDVLYFPPIHPIGHTFRKGKNNAPAAEPDDVGSPWGIGAQEGGHKAIHPQLGTLEEFRNLVAQARQHGLEVALDIAFQCSPDHPYVREHPDWFRKRPDGTIQYAENPPKKYQDIYPIYFETDQWQPLWEELTSVVQYWVDQGVRIFRVDNPHTKSFHFWEYLIGKVKAENPDVLFLSEAFTRPAVMYGLAKLGFTQSYTYFTWRNTKDELVEFMTELTQSRVREFYRPNLWPNTPDILPEYLQVGGRPAFMARLILAATLGASYGIYGPAFEHCIGEPRQSGSEEYLDSEKYQLRHWDQNRPDSLKDLIARVNQIRRDNPALQSNDSLEFHPIDNPQLICYSKRSPDRRNTILVVVNLDPYHTQSGWVEVPLDQWELEPEHPYQVHDLLGDARFLWSGQSNYVELDPRVIPAHVFQVRRRVRTEQHFEYYM